MALLRFGRSKQRRCGGRQECRVRAKGPVSEAVIGAVEAAGRRPKGYGTLVAGRAVTIGRRCRLSRQSSGLTATDSRTTASRPTGQRSDRSTWRLLGHESDRRSACWAAGARRSACAFVALPRPRTRAAVSEPSRQCCVSSSAFVTHHGRFRGGGELGRVCGLRAECCFRRRRSSDCWRARSTG